jgi:hypothetical protein
MSITAENQSIYHGVALNALMELRYIVYRIEHGHVQSAYVEDAIQVLVGANANRCQQSEAV